MNRMVVKAATILRYFFDLGKAGSISPVIGLILVISDLITNSVLGLS